MKYLANICLCAMLVLSNGHAHEVQENTARISIQHGSVSLSLNIHSSAWADSVATHQLDDEVLTGTELSINKRSLPLKLRKIEKGSDHYRIEYIAEESVAHNIHTAKLVLPPELGNVVVTVVRATTKLTYQGKVASFSFD